MGYELAGKRVWVAGHRGMVGGALLRRLAVESCETITIGRETLDLRRQADVEDYLSDTRTDAIVIAAGTVGGILANDSYPADFLYDNLMIVSNLIEAAHRADIDRVVILGSSCIYPKMAPQPIAESSLLTGPLEPTNEWYALAKIAGIKLAQAYRRQHGRDYIAAMPTNLYGPGDNYDAQSSHVLPALLRKVHEAKKKGQESVTIWGSGTPSREFLHVDDCADAIIFLMENYSESEHVNIGSGYELTIIELVKMICEIIGFDGHIFHDLSKPDGTTRKLLDSSKLAGLGWAPRIELRAGIAATYEAFLRHESEAKATLMLTDC